MVVGVVVEVDRGHTARQDVNDSHRYDLIVNEVMLVKGAESFWETSLTVVGLAENNIKLCNEVEDLNISAIVF